MCLKYAKKHVHKAKYLFLNGAPYPFVLQPPHLQIVSKTLQLVDSVLVLFVVSLSQALKGMLLLGGGGTRLFPGDGLRRNSADTQQSGHTQRSKMEVVSQTARRKVSDARQSRL